MNKKKIYIFFSILFFITSCSFDNKTGLWKDEKGEKKRISNLELKQKEIVDIKAIYSSDKPFQLEKNLLKKINLSNPVNILDWKMHGQNQQKFLSNIYLDGIENKFLKKKIGRKKFNKSKNTNSPLFYKSSVYLSDDKGTIYNINLDGKVNWKKNIYKKLYKKIYKNISFSIYKNKLYVADNIGFIYSINLNNGEIIWIKNHGIPLKSKIKVFNDKIFLLNQDNRIISLDINNGSIVWSVRLISSFIKSQDFLSIALSKKDDVIVSTSSGDLLNLDSSSGQIKWSLNTLDSLLAHATDFFKSSDIVISDKNIIFSTQTDIFSIDLDSGYNNWKKNVNSIGTPIVDGENIFIVTENGFFVIIDKKSGDIISSTNILNILKKKNKNTKATGFVLGSGKIYSTTLNGYLIISSATSGKVEKFKKIGGQITAGPIITDGKLFVYTHDFKILGFN